MNQFQKIWLEAYKSWLIAVSPFGERSPSDYTDAREHADAMFSSLSNLKETAMQKEVSTIEIINWDGEGIPPIGAVCEFSSHKPNEKWHQGIVRYLSDHTVVIEFTSLINGKAESISHPRTMKFRPVISPEYAERNEVARQMMRVVGNSKPTPMNPLSMLGALALYDAGYRMQE